jgi:hypothetical protein
VELARFERGRDSQRAPVARFGPPVSAAFARGLFIDRLDLTKDPNCGINRSYWECKEQAIAG